MIFTQFLHTAVPIFLYALTLYFAFIFFLATNTYVKGGDWNKKVENFISGVWSIIEYIFSKIICIFIIAIIWFLITLFFDLSNVTSFKILKISYILLGVKIVRDLFMAFYKKNIKFLSDEGGKILSPVGSVLKFFLSIVHSFQSFYIFLFGTVGLGSLVLHNYFSLYIAVPIIISVLIFLGLAMFLEKVLKKYMDLLEKYNLKEFYIPYIFFIMWLPLIYVIKTVYP